MPVDGLGCGRGRARPAVLAQAGWASAYAAMAWLGGLTRVSDSAISLVWPAAGVGFLWVLCGSLRRSAAWPEYLGLAAVAALLNGVTGAPWVLAGALGAINVVQAAVSVWVFWRVAAHRRSAGGDRVHLADLRDLQALLAAALAGALTAAPLAGAATAVVRHAPLLAAVGQWAVRNAVSTVVVASVGLLELNLRPLLRRVLRKRRRAVRAAFIAEVAALAAATGVLFGWVFATSWGRPFVFVVLLLTVWSGLRLGLRVTTVHLVVCGFAATLLTMAGSGPFGQVQPSAMRASAVQAFIGVIAIIGLGLAMGRRARLVLDRTTERSNLLGELARAVSESLDLDRTLARFAGLVVPRFCDHCVVDLIGADGRLRRHLVVHAPGCDVGCERWVQAGQDPAFAQEHPVTRVLATGRGYLTVEPAPGAGLSWDGAIPSLPGAADSGRVGCTAALVVPLVPRGRVIGAVSLACSASGRTYVADDLALATQLADRAAVAIDNARLYRQQQDVSLTLQRSLMPERLPTAAGLSVAARYLAATEGGEVGGDWYDLLAMPTGRVAIVIGDVMGRGVAAAALMGQIRAALRAYAGQDLPPAQVLAHADELVRGLSDDMIVTCVYGVYDPREHQLVLSNAGHVPPLLLDRQPAAAAQRAPSAATRIDASGPALGAAGGAEPYRHVVVDLPPERTLALYTDGLVESRRSSIEANIAILVQELRAAGSDLKSTCKAIVAKIDPDRTDDAALLLLRPEPAARLRVATREVRPDGREVGGCRQFTVRSLTDWGADTDTITAAELLVSELVTNSVRYARPPLSLSLSTPEAGVVIEVRDHGGAQPRLRSAAPTDEGGRGLMLVAALASRWGTRILPDGGKAVWCQLGHADRQW